MATSILWCQATLRPPGGRAEKGRALSKRRKRRPDLPQDTLARARREAGLSDAPAPPAAPRPLRAHRSEEPRTAPRRARGQRVAEDLTQEEIADRLANPVRLVSEAQLREQYGYVVKDLRSMGLLAAALFILMILAALLL